jgi:hypothetical protein
MIILFVGVLWMDPGMLVRQNKRAGKRREGDDGDPTPKVRQTN